MENIIIVDAGSTGHNLVEDAVRRGYRPIVIETSQPGLREMREETYRLFFREVEILSEKESYDETLALAKGYSPVAVMAGSEDGVSLANRLAADLGLPGNPVSRLEAMTKKDAMHVALKQAGIRYIKGRKVTSSEEALAFCRENGLSTAVVKPIRSAGSQGLFLCDNLTEVEHAVDELLCMKDLYGDPITEAVVQERIVGVEYIVNTASCNGIHHLNSVLRYKKEKTEEGGYIYDYAESINHLEPGHTAMIEYAYQVADAIGVRNGLIHGEYMIDEKGPVLIEVNCRPMGASLTAEFLDPIFGHHETDVLLDTLLDRERFMQRQTEPYAPKYKGVFKFIIVPGDFDAESHPIWEIARHLRSTFKISVRAEDSMASYIKTRDLESAGGVIYMLHEDENVVMRELHLLRRIEQKYFSLLLSDGKSRRWFIDARIPAADPDDLFRTYNCCGSVLIAVDEKKEIAGAQVVTPSTLSDAHTGFDHVIIAYQKSLLEMNDPACLRLIFDTMDKVRPGGRVIIPKSTYRYMAYEQEGAEVLMQVKGLEITPPMPGFKDLVIGTRRN